MKKRKIKWCNVALLFVSLYFVFGILYSAYDSHKNPEKWLKSIDEEIMFNFLGGNKDE